MRPLSSLRAVFSKGQIAGVMRTRALASILWAFNFARTSANPHFSLQTGAFPGQGRGVRVAGGRPAGWAARVLAIIAA